MAGNHSSPRPTVSVSSYLAVILSCLPNERPIPGKRSRECGRQLEPNPAPQTGYSTAVQRGTVSPVRRAAGPDKLDKH